MWISATKWKWSLLLNPCKIRTRILAGSCRNLGGNPARIFLPAGISPGSRQDSRREVKFTAPKISPGLFFESRQDSRQEAKIPAAKFLPGSCRKSRQDSRREAKIPAAKISALSCREAHQDSRREAIIPAAKISLESYHESRQVSRREENSRWQKSWCDLAGNLAKIGDGMRNSWWDSLRESRHEFLLDRAQCLWLEIK